jgi:glutamate-1-semialdehyde 2,1-aminomutase
VSPSCQRNPKRWVGERVSGASEGLFERAQAVIPGGVNSPVRAFGSVGGSPYFVTKAEGVHVWDADGTRRIDLVQSYGAIIAGHTHPVIVDAVVSAAADGTSYGAPTEREVVLAEEIAARVPSIEKVRLVSSGTEATMSAIRVARGFTGRDRILKFAGCYHGHSDQLLVAGGSGVALMGRPDSAGVTANQVADTMVAPYNVVPRLDGRTACVIVEPVAANMGLIAPGDGFLEGLRSECDRVGALLIFDEVISGFRLGNGGAQARFGVIPDLTCLGKVIGGGLPVGAFGGRAEVMDSLAPLGPVYQAGTLSGNPLATAAGLAALSLLTDDVFIALEKRATRFAEQLETVLRAAGLDARVPAVGPLVGLYFGDRLPTDFVAAQQTDLAAYAALFHALLDAGVAIAPGAYEVMFPGLAHTDEVLDRIVDIASSAATAAVATLRSSATD